MAEEQSCDAGKESPTLSVMVEKLYNFTNQKGDSHQLIVRVEHGEKRLGESQKIEIMEDGHIDIHYLVSMPVNIEDTLAIDELACRPVLVTLLDTSAPQQKEKRAPSNQKLGGGDERTSKGDDKSRPDDRSSVIGQCSIDLMPLLRGKTEVNITTVLHPVPGSPLELLTAEQPQVMLDINISISQPILKTEDNFMSITTESLYSVPEAFIGAGNTGVTYVAACPLPINSEKENVVVYAGGQYKPPVPSGEREERRKRWPMPAAALGMAACVNNEMIVEDSVVHESGDFREYDDREHRRQSEREKARIQWNSERRCYMNSTALCSFKKKIEQSRYLPVEIFRMPTGGAAGGGTGKRKPEEELAAPPISFHGLAYVDLAPLLYPGVNRVRGAYRVIAYTDKEMNCKAKRYSGVAEDAAKLAWAILTRSPSLTSVTIPLDGHRPPTPEATSPFPSSKKDEKGGKDKKGKRKGKAAADKAEEEPEAAPVNPEGQLFVEAKSYVMIEIVLDRPLVERKSDEQKIQRVSEIIPPRPLFPKRTNTAQKAVENYHYQVGSIANMLLYEIRDSVGYDGIQALSEGNFDEKRQKLLYHLNTSGKYLAFKEQLKYAVIKIVREKFCKTSTFQDPDELQKFICDLYIYLLDEMHIGLNRVLSVEDERPMPVSLTTTDQLKHFAREAEVNGNYELAATYYQERIARDRSDPNHWLDYGIFCMSMNDLTKAEECFKECITIDQHHIYGLMLCGVVFSMQRKAELCEAMFEAATAIEPCNILLWTVFGLSYDFMGNNIRSEMALTEATRLSWAEAEAAAEACRQKEAELQAAAAAACGSRSDGRESPESIDKSPPGSPSSKRSSRKQSPKSAQPAKPENPVKEKEKKGKQSKRQVEEPHAPAETVPQTHPPAVPERTIYIQAAEFLLQVQAKPLVERALACHLLDRFGGETCDYYVALGRLMLQRKRMEEVEINLSAAVQLHYQTVDAWALMGHMKYLTGDYEGAKTCYLTTLSFMVDTPELHSIYLRLASIHLNCAEFKEARDTFLLACKNSPSCVSWLGVGIACYRMNEFAESEEALSEANILNNMDPEVWAYLCLIALRCGRRDEAEQAYKFTMKLNLRDQTLLDEIRRLQCEMGFGDPSFNQSSAESSPCYT